MTDDKNETTTAGSERIVLAGNKGVMPASRTESQNENIPAGNEELAWGRRNIPEGREVHLVRSVFRKTELHGTPRNQTKKERDKRRRKIIREVQKSDQEATSGQITAACRDILDRIIENQDRFCDDVLVHLADLQQQIDALACNAGKERNPSSGCPEAVH